MKSGFLQHLKFAIRRISIDIKRESVRALANLSSDYKHTSEIVRAGGLVPLVEALSSSDPLCIRFATMGLANLTTNKKNKTGLYRRIYSCHFFI